MNRKLYLIPLFVILALILSVGGATAQEAQSVGAQAALGTAFTYQGQLKNNGNPINGTCDFQFGLFDAATSGTQIGTTQTTSNVTVAAGLFTVNLDFGASAFTGSARFLDIQVRCPAGSGLYTQLSPRQTLTPAPYALYAASGGTTYTPGTGLTLAGNSFALDTNFTDGRYWKSGGNAGTTVSNFLGTTDNMTLTLAVNNTAALKLVPNATSPNVIVGHTSNSVGAGVAGATIGGGGASGSANSVTANFGTVSGGRGNAVSGAGATVGGGGWNGTAVAGNSARAAASTVAGGYDNLITTAGAYATVGGGWSNTASGFDAVIGGGYQNTASDEGTTVAGGENNTASGAVATVSGGTQNTASGAGATVGGGGWDGTTISGNQARAAASTIAGGFGNVITNTANYAAIGGGRQNAANGAYATIPGGRDNVAQGQYSFAAGRGAQALNDGAFVWADSTGATLASTVPNEFLVRASGGITLYTDSGATVGVELAPGSGSWNTVSDRNLKANFLTVSGLDILNRLAGLPVLTWNYTTQDPSIHHIGPMAQDFHAAFNVGENDTTISTVDAQGVAFAAIQGLYQVVQAKDAQVATLSAENVTQADQIAALQQQNAGLEARLSALEQKVGGGASPLSSGVPVSWLALGALIGLGAFGLGRRWNALKGGGR